MSRLPTIFLSHGSPMHALDAGGAGAAWRAIADSLPRPRAVLVASAHWETSLPMLSGGERPETIHDFSGFPPALYRLQYPASGSPELAQQVAGLLRTAGHAPAVNACRGLDHGAWVPLRWMYPEHDVPVVQISVQPSLGTEHHLRLGTALAPLAGDGVLVIGSGHVTHNLGDWARNRNAAAPLDYVLQFADWLHGRLVAGDRDAVLDYRARAPSAARAHPSEEHFLPLLVAWGAAGQQPGITRAYGAVEGAALSMDAYLFS
jgi:4,5-DOPA dioxygenase extradiol